MTQYNPQYPPPPGYAPPPPASPQSTQPPGRRRFPFVAGYVLWFLPSLWRDAGRNWRGFGFLYLLILFLISWGVTLAKHHGPFTDFVRNDVPKFAKEVPTVDIKDGVVTTDVPYEPYIITNPDNGNALVVIDTTGQTTEPPEPEPSLLLTKNKLIVRNNNKVETHDLSQVKQFHFSSQDVQSFFDKLHALYWPVIFPSAVAWSMIWRLIQVLIYALIGMAIASGVRPPLSFGALMRLAALAITPVVLLDTVFAVTGLSFGCAWTTLGITLAIVLLVFMVRANNDPNAAPPPGRAYPPPGMYPPPGAYPQQQGMYPPPGMQPAPYGQPPQAPAPPAYQPPAPGGYPPPPPPRAPGY